MYFSRAYNEYGDGFLRKQGIQRSQRRTKVVNQRGEKCQERGVIVYPYCYPVPKRDGDAKLKEDSIPEIENYKEMLWADFDRNNHPNDIGLALAFSDNEDLSYGSRFIFKRTGELLTEVCDSIRGNSIIAEPGEKIDYELAQHELLLANDSVIGDMLMWYVVRPIEAEMDYNVKVFLVWLVI